MLKVLTKGLREDQQTNFEYSELCARAVEQQSEDRMNKALTVVVKAAFMCGGLMLPSEHDGLIYNNVIPLIRILAPEFVEAQQLEENEATQNNSGMSGPAQSFDEENNYSRSDEGKGTKRTDRE